MKIRESSIRPNLLNRLNFNKSLLLICLLGLFVRLLYFLLVVADNQLSGDAASYHLSANLFADGLGFTEPFRYLFGSIDLIPINGETTEVITPIGHIEPTAGHPPVWTLLLAVISFLGFTTVFEQQIVSILLGIPSIIIAGFIGRKISSERLGLITAFLTATYAFIWINDGLLMAETCAITGAMASILAGLALAENPSIKRAFIFGIFISPIVKKVIFFF